MTAKIEPHIIERQLVGLPSPDHSFDPKNAQIRFTVSFSSEGNPQIEAVLLNEHLPKVKMSQLHTLTNGQDLLSSPIELQQKILKILTNQPVTLVNDTVVVLPSTPSSYYHRVYSSPFSQKRTRTLQLLTPVVAEYEEAAKSDNLQKIAEACFRLASEYFKLGQLFSALRCYNELGCVSQKISNFKTCGMFVGSAYNGLGLTYYNLKDLPQAERGYENALKIFRRVDYPRGESATLTNCASLYRSLANYERAIETFRISIQIKSKMDDVVGEGIALNNLGLVYFDTKNYSEALKCHRKSLVLFRRSDQKKWEAKALNNIGIAYFNLSSLGQAIDYYRAALSLYASLDNPEEHEVAISTLRGSLNQLGLF